MSYRKILAPVFGSNTDETTLEQALELAKQFSAHVQALFVRIDPVSVLPLEYPGVISGSAAQYAIEAAIKASDAAQKIVEASFAKATDKCGVVVSAPGLAQARPTAELKVVQGDYVDEVEHHSRLCDLIVFAGSAGNGPYGPTQAAFESALMSGARPVLLVSPGTKTAPGQRIGIAYDGSAAAAHAVTAALPFLERAKDLHAFEVTTETVSHLAELESYMGLRGLRIGAHQVDAKTDSTGDALLQAVQARGCDLLVLGGYGHSRVREFVFGGVTRHVLHHRPTFAVLMAH
jgi:nucleotide-binding universal stress UspA family protein